MLEEFTRTEYESRLLAGEGMPQEFFLVEPDGTKTYVILTSGLAAPVRIPFLQDPNVREAVWNMADLLEYYYVDLEKAPVEGVDTPMSDFWQLDESDKVERAPELKAMITEGLARLEAWLERPTQGNKADLVPMAEQVIAQLRFADF